MDKPRILMKDVAQVAGVHQTTVSLALRNHPSLPKTTRERIQKLAQEMGYRPDPALSALVAYRQSTKNQPTEQVIAWVINVRNTQRLEELHVHRLLVAGAKERAQQLGYKLDTFWLGKEYKDGKSLNRVLKARGIQGVIFGAFEYNDEPLELDWDLFSCIKVDPLPETLRFDTVHSDQLDAVDQVLKALTQMGIKRIGLAVSEYEEIYSRFTYASGFHTHRRLVDPADWIEPYYFQHDANYGVDVVPETVEWARKNKIQALISNWNNLELAARKLNEEGQVCRFIPLDADEKTAVNGGINQDHQENGRRAVDMAVGHIKTFRRGIEPRPCSTLVTPLLIPIPEKCPLKAEVEANLAATR